jgi:predicted alpha/beta hydrolase
MEPRPHKLTQPDTLATHGALNFTTADARHLRGALFTADAPIGAVLINSATAVPQRYYQRFATFLAANGLTTMTYDYRGIGVSRVGSLRESPATMSDWGARDFPAALRALREAAPGLPVALIGHSFGGQAVGLCDEAATLDAIMFVAAQSGYWGHWPMLQRHKMRALWTLVLPAAVGAWGYLPGRLGIGEDMPGEAALQWSRWSNHRDYLVSEVGGAALDRFAALEMPRLAYTITDDAYAPPAAVDALLGWMPQDGLARRLVAPRDLGVPAIGHFGFFRQPFAPTLWQEALTFLRASLTR